MTGRWVLLFVIFCARAGIGTQLISVAVLMPEVRSYFGLNYTEAGILLGLFMTAGIFLALPSGIIISSLGVRRVLQIGLLSMVLSGILISLSHSLSLAFISRLLGGIGAVFVTVAGAKALTDAFEGKEETTAMSVLGVAFPFGIALGMSLLPIIFLQSSLQIAFLATCIIPIAALGVLILLPSVGHQKIAKTANYRNLSQNFGWKRIQSYELSSVLLAGICFALMSAGGYVVFSSYASALLVSRGISDIRAEMTIGLFSWFVILTIPIGGVVADRFSRSQKNRLIACGCLFAALSMIAICFTSKLTALLVILCAAQGLAVGPVMALPNYILSPDSRHVGIGIFYTLYYLGATTLPMLGGAILDVTTELASAVVFSAICLCLTPLFCSISLRTLTRAKNRSLKAN